MKALFDNANDAVITTDTIGCVMSWNKTAEKKKLICEILPGQGMVSK